MCRPYGRCVRRPRPFPVAPMPVPQPPQPQEPSGPLPLKGVAVDVKVVDFVASVTIKQRFENDEENPIEAVYQFPLAEKNCICDFYAEIDGKKVVGQCKEKEEAKDTYDDAIASGHGAYMLEQEAPDLFTVNVGNLPPGKSVEVGITYVTELEFVDGQLQFVLPTSKQQDESQSSYRRKSSNTKASDPPSLDIKINLAMTSNIRSIASSSHPISFEFGDTPAHATVTLAEDYKSQEKDFILTTKLAQPHQPCGRVQRDENGNLAAMVSLYPKLDLEDDEEIYTEMIFIVDRSGSMSGSRIDKVKDTMQIFLRSLGEGTMFNIVGFGTRTEMLFKDGSKEYNDTNLDLATKHVTNLKANLGGTNILQPLEMVLKSKTIDGYPRQLFILTDGEVSNTIECIEFVRKHADTTRVFTFGIGNEASQELVKGMAKAGEGFYEFITGNDNMETKVMRQLSRAMQPALSNLTIDWGGLEAHQTPYRLPPLFAGGRLVIYSLLPEGSKASDVTINAQTAIKPFSATVKLNPEEPEDGQLLHKLATRSLIRDFEEGRSYLHRPNGGFVSGKSQQDVKEETIRLSTTYGVLSKFTAFVAEEEREEATEGTMQVRRCNVIQQQQQQQQQQRQQQLVRPAQHFGMARGGGGRGGMLKCAAMPVSQSLSSTGATKSKSKRKVEKKKKESASPRKGGASLNFFARSKSSSSSVTAMPPPPPAAAYGGAPPAAPPPAPAHAFAGDLCAFETSSPLTQLQSAPPLLSPVASSSFKKMDKECDERQRRSSSPKRMSRRNEEAEALVCMDDENEAASEEEEEEEKVAGPPPAEMKQIIMKQKASGCWALKDVASLLGRIKSDHIKKGVPSELENKADDAVLDLWATAIVVEYLTSKFADQKTNWDLVVKKAKKWILRQHKQLNIKPESLDWLTKASAFVQSHA